MSSTVGSSAQVVGLPGAVTFATTDSTVTGFVYGVNQDPPATTIAVTPTSTGASVTVNIVPDRYGDNVLRVRLKDRAGNPGPIRTRMRAQAMPGDPNAPTLTPLPPEAQATATAAAALLDVQPFADLLSTAVATLLPTNSTLVAGLPLGTTSQPATAPAAAPAGLDWTGDASLCQPWSTLGAPSISLPTGLSEAGLPFALQLVQAPTGDTRMLGAALWCERALDPAPAPPMDR